MKIFEDSHNGEAIRIICDAPQLPLPKTISRWRTARELLALTRRHDARYLQVFEDAYEQVWFASDEPGYALSIAIDRWTTSQAELADEDFHVVIPFDNLVYWAKVEQGQVMFETVGTPHKILDLARPKLDNGERILGFKGGLATPLIEQIIPLQACPFGQTDFAYQHIYRTFAKQRLLHPALAGWAAAIVLIPLLTVLLWPKPEAPPAPAQLPPPVPKYLAEYQASRQISGFLDALFSNTTLILHRNGLKTLNYNATTNGLTYHGGYASQFPASVVAQDGQNASVTLQTNTWTVKTDLHVEQDRRAPDRSFYAVLAHMMQLSELPDVSISIKNFGNGGDLVTADINLTSHNPGRETFIRLARHMQGYPVRTTRANCTFAAETIQSCHISLVAKGIKT